MKKKIIFVLCIVLAVSLVAAGLLLKQNAAVLTKSINICLECIGIG